MCNGVAGLPLEDVEWLLQEHGVVEVRSKIRSARVGGERGAGAGGGAGGGMGVVSFVGTEYLEFELNTLAVVWSMSLDWWCIRRSWMLRK